MKREKIFKLLESQSPIDEVLVKGWIRTRGLKNIFFLEINDGSCLKNVQVVANETLPNFDDIKKLSTGSAVSVGGKLVESRAAAKNGKSSQNRLRLSAWRRILIRCKKSDTAMNF